MAKTRGRDSAASLMTVPVLEKQNRPDAPYDLTDEQFAMLSLAVQESGGAMKIVEHTVNNEMEVAA